MNTQETQVVQITDGTLWQMGFDFYCEMKPIDVCITEMERRGWVAANRAEAEAGMVVDGMEDEMFWARGQW